MSCRSRVAGLRKGWQRVKNNWDDFKVEAVEAPATILDLDYSKSGGIWDLTSTTQFAKTDTGGGGGSAPLGLSSSLLTISGQNDAWLQRTIDISSYANSTVYLVFQYLNTQGTFESDIQLDLIEIDGNTYSFENQTHSFQTSDGGDYSTYAGVTWANLAVEEDNRGLWQVDQGGTPSGNTGRTDAADGSYYVYAEMSGNAANANYNLWLRSPEITLGSSPTLTFYEARTGADIGQLDVYLDVTG